MKTRTRRVLLLSPLLLLLLIAGAWLLLDAWLEGAGGRRAVEAALTQRLGMPVGLHGEFNVMLLPSIGVSGTDLVIGAPGAESELARSGKYAVALAVLPLLDGELLIESFQLREGLFHFERLPDRDPADDAGVDPAGLRLPEIRSLAVRDFRVSTGGEEPLRLLNFEVEDFAAGAEAPFELAVAGYGKLDGRLNWDPGQARLAVDADWRELLPGDLQLEAVVGFAAGNGSLRSEWRPDRGDHPGPGLTLGLTWSRAPGGFVVERLVLESGGQQMAGRGCLVTDAAVSLQLELRATAIDFDALPDLGALIDAFEDGPGRPSAADTSAAAGFDIRVRLHADEARLQGAIARGTVIGVGAEPACENLLPVQ